MTDPSLLSHDQFSLLGIVIAVAAYTVVVHQVLDQKIRKIVKHDGRDGMPRKPSKALRLDFLSHTREFLLSADLMLVLAGGLLIVRIWLWAGGRVVEPLWNWLDLDRLIVAQVGVALSFLAALHVRALLYRMGWIYRIPPGSYDRPNPPDDLSPETVRRIAEKLEQQRST